VTAQLPKPFTGFETAGGGRQLGVLEEDGGGKQLGILERLLFLGSFWLGQYNVAAGPFKGKWRSRFSVIGKSLTSQNGRYYVAIIRDVNCFATTHHTLFS
jgi:hypothetical protein